MQRRSTSVPAFALAGLLLLAGLSLLGACTPVRETSRCRHIEATSMGPENAFRVRLEGGAAEVIDEATERINFTATSLPPWSGPITLVHLLDGHETNRWNITMPVTDGSVYRCSIGMVLPGSTCNVTIAGGAMPVAGEWTIEANGNRVLEASVSFRICD